MIFQPPRQKVDVRIRENGRKGQRGKGEIERQIKGEIALLSTFCMDHTHLYAPLNMAGTGGPRPIRISQMQVNRRRAPIEIWRQGVINIAKRRRRNGKESPTYY